MVPAHHQPRDSTGNHLRRRWFTVGTASSRQRRRRLVIVVGLAVWLVGATAMPAAAHLRLQRSEPPSGGVVRRSPPAITLEFSKPIEPAFTAVRVLTADGQAARTGRIQPVDGQPGRIRVPLTEPLPSGRHAVSYRVVATDGHTIRGSFGFTIRLPAAAATPSPAPAGHQAPKPARTPPTPAAPHPTAEHAAGAAGRADDTTPAGLEAAAAAALEQNDRLAGRLVPAVRLLLFAALVLLVGGTVFLLLAWPAGFAVPRVTRLLAAAAGAALAATTAGIVLQGATAAGLRLADALDPEVLRATLTTRYGVAAATRLGLLLALLLLLAATARRSRRPPARRPGVIRRWMALTGVPLLVGVVATVSLVGHAGSGPAAPLGLATDGLHLAAVSVWLGGLALLVAVVLPRRHPLELRQVLPRFSRLAFAAVVVIVTTGLLQSWRQVATPDALLTTEYGRLLLAKLTLVVLLLAAAAVSRSIVQRRLLPTSALIARPDGPGAARLDPDIDTVARLRRSVGVELAIAVAVLALTAVLVATNPARQAEQPSITPNAAATP